VNGQYAEALAGINKAYEESFSLTVASLKSAAVKFGLGMVDTFGTLSPHVQAIMMEKIGDGTTDLADSINDTLSRAGAAVVNGELGFAGMSGGQQAQFLLQRIKINENAIEAAQKYGSISFGLSAADIIGASRRPLTDAEMKTRLLNYYRGEMPNATASLLKAQTEFGASPTNDNFASLGKAQQVVADLASGMRTLSVESNLALKGLIEFGVESERALNEGLGNAIFNLISGTGSLRESLLGLANDVTRSFSAMAANNLVGALLGGNSVAQGGQGAFTSFFTAMFNGGGGGLPDAPPAPVVGYANGGYLGGTFLPFQAFASGGIVARPTLGLIAEGGKAEAVVPLTGNRSIPVEMSGGGAVNIYVVSNVHEAVQKGFQRNRDQLIDLISSDVKKGGSVQKAIRRSGR
jgi:hypothetical protein